MQLIQGRNGARGSGSREVLILFKSATPWYGMGRKAGRRGGKKRRKKNEIEFYKDRTERGTVYRKMEMDEGREEEERMVQRKREEGEEGRLGKRDGNGECDARGKSRKKCVKKKRGKGKSL